jgi:hypothetical protein
MYEFEFDENEVNLILAGLGKLPAELSYNMINRIHSTVSVKQEASADPGKEEVK